jgi:hypothetical protein
MDMQSQITRRNALTTVAALAVVPAVPVAALAVTADPDPIFAVIEEHRTAVGAYSAAIDRRNDLEERLPSGGWDFSPEWIAADRDVDVCEGEPDRAARRIIETKPTTLAGVAALLNYVASATPQTFPDYSSGEGVDDADPDDLDQPWEHYLHRMLAEAVTEIAEARS